MGGVDWGEWLTRWTVRLALALYVVTAVLRLADRERRAARVAWTVGCVLFLAHVACAFHFVHGWSHDDAYRQTARQTRELFGLDWGGGLYLNYLFTLAWVVDAGYWWAGGLDAYDRRPWWVEAGIHLFFAFMAFNGAAVFATGPTRTVAIVATVALLVLALGRLRLFREGRRRGLG